jgi:hypothetical protein
MRHIGLSILLVFCVGCSLVAQTGSQKRSQATDPNRERQGTESSGVRKPDSCCDTKQQMIQTVLSHLSSLRSQLDSGELAVVDYRIGRALMPIDPKLGRTHLNAALSEARTAPEGDVVIDTKETPTTDDKRLEFFYKDFLRKQQTIQNSTLAELIKTDFTTAAEQINGLTPSTRGYLKLKYGDVVLASPPERNTNTHLVCLVAQTIGTANVDGATKFFVEHFRTLDEPVFLPALRFFDDISSRNQVAGEQIKGAIQERIQSLLSKGDTGVVVQTHLSLSRALAGGRSAKLIGALAETALANVKETTGDDFPPALQNRLASAFHQYAVTLRRFPETEEQASGFARHRDRILKQIGISLQDFEDRQLTMEDARDAKKFAHAMSYKSEEFANQIAAETESNSLGDLATEEVEKKYQQSTGYRKFSFALKLNEILYSTDPSKAEKYLLQARSLSKEQSDIFQQIMMQTVVYAQGINRCSKETLASLAEDPINSASSLIRKHNSNRKEEAVYISTLLSPFIMEYSQIDFSGALKTIAEIPDAWVQAELETVALESSLARKNQ